MPRKKSKKKPEPSPPKALKNITNQKNPVVGKCFVKMQKLDADTANGDVENKNFRKRKAEETKEGEHEISRSKKSVQPSTSTSATTVEKLINKYAQLQKVISNKYVTVVERLKLDFVPLCAENIEHCHRKHYKKAPLPKLPTVTQNNLIRNSLQQSRYKIFISLVFDLCQMEQFPGDAVLTNIVKMLLTLNPESNHNKFLQPIVDQLLWLFDVILRIFPPCWLALRPSYMKFLRNTIEMSKLLPDKTLRAENTIFEVVLMLLEDTIDDRKNTRPNRSNKHFNNSLTHFDDEYHNMQHWEKYDDDEQTFSALSRSTRLDRLMQVLHLIAKMLEMDLAMWMLRYHKNPMKHLYNGEDQPLVITLFSLTSYTRSSVLMKKVITLFALCIEKDLDEHYLKVMERFISLLGNVQNLCEIETTTEGIRYPYIGPATTSFVMDLYKTIEVHMKKDIKKYMRLINNLRCPFVRYEYIDVFLKRLNPASGKMCPQKIVENFRKNRWLECEPEDERVSGGSRSQTQSTVYRQDYLQILLDALRTYCDLHGTKEFLADVQSSNIKALDTLQKSPQKMPNNCEIDLNKMSKQIVDLEANLDMSMILREPRKEIPIVNIRINSELYTQYRNDIKYVMILHAYISALQSEHADDFSQLMEFLKDFAPKY